MLQKPGITGSIISKKHPTIYKLINCLQKEESETETMCLELDIGHSVKQPQMQKNRNLNMRLQRLTSWFEEYKSEGRINQYLRSCAYNMTL
ncbi:hypothetical protein C0J52_23142 [Blattella germanica]|nr:hypothetical protein C0J52_23142 [Blattella germanica]